MLFRYIPESARWLITNNRIPEAKKLIQIAAKENKVTISDERLDELLMPKTEEKVDPNAKKATVLDIFRYPNLRKRSFIVLFDWFANNITYYGLSWNTNNLAGNPYLNFVVSGAVEIPAYVFLILTLNRWGRKAVLCGGMIVAGVALLLTIAVPDGGFRNGKSRLDLIFFFFFRYRLRLAAGDFSDAGEAVDNYELCGCVYFLDGTVSDCYSKCGIRGEFDVRPSRVDSGAIY